MKRHLSYFVSNFPILVFNLTYTLSCVLLFLGLLWLLPSLNLILLALISLGFLMLCLVVWAWLHTLFTIPQKMAGAYDRIKNAIAVHEITSLDEYVHTLNSFLVSFFDFSFLDVQYANVKIGTHDPVFSSEKISGLLDWEAIGRSCEQSADIQHHGSVSIGKEKLFAYTIPVWFMNDPLGFFTVCSKRRLGALQLKILNDLEDNYIDDQVIGLLLNESTNEA
jgi:hypothetical protein